MYGAYAMVQVQ